MRKLLLMVILLYGVSCSNPEDKATGNTDSTSFNKSGNDKNLNSPGDEVGNQSHAAKNDTSSNSSTPGQSGKQKDSTNRSYKPGGNASH